MYRQQLLQVRSPQTVELCPNVSKWEYIVLVLVQVPHSEFQYPGTVQCTMTMHVWLLLTGSRLLWCTIGTRLELPVADLYVPDDKASTVSEVQDSNNNLINEGH
jgi:hypothetical protein